MIFIIWKKSSDDGDFDDTIVEQFKLIKSAESRCDQLSEELFDDMNFKILKVINGQEMKMIEMQIKTKIRLTRDE